MFSSNNCLRMSNWSTLCVEFSPEQNLYGEYETLNIMNNTMLKGFPVSSASKESTCNAGDPGSIPGQGRSPGGGHGKSTPVFLPGEFHGQGAWWGTVHRVARSQTSLSDQTQHSTVRFKINLP